MLFFAMCLSAHENRANNRARSGIFHAQNCIYYNKGGTPCKSFGALLLTIFIFLHKPLDFCKR